MDNITLGAQVRIKGRLHGQDTVNVLNFATATAISDAGDVSPLLTALLTAVIECVVDALIPAVTQDWTFTSADARVIKNNAGFTVGTDPIEANPEGGPMPGEGGVCSVSFAAALMNIRTGLGGRSGRGKLFLPPPGEDHSTQSAMDGTAATAFAAFATCMVGKFIGSGATTAWRLGVLSRKLAGANLANFNTAFFEASSLPIVSTLAVLSKRKAGHGR